MQKRRLSQLTVDEVWENDIMTKKKFSPQEIIRNGKRGKLVNAVGTTPEIGITIKTDYLDGESVFLVCSDGLYKMVSPRKLTKVIKRISKGSSVREGMETLMKDVYDAGAVDNVSMIIISTKEV